METALIVAVLLVVSTVAGVLVGRAFKAQDVQLQEIHVLVNSRLTEALEHITELKNALRVEKDK